jgi:FecR protein
MKTKLLPALSVGVVACFVFAPAAMAQRQLGKKKGPTSKLYLAEVKGDARITTGERIYEAKQATAFDAPGTVVETGEESHNAFVYSNGTGMYLDQNTRVEINRFVQEPFQPKRASTEFEPSISQSEVFVAQGFVGICTSGMVSGSSMVYSTPHAAISIRGRKVAIETNPTETVVYLLEGDISVRGSDRRDSSGGQLLRAGERAVIRPGAPGQPPSITIGPIDQSVMPSLDERVTVACNAKKTVTFEMIEKKSEAGVEGSDTPEPTPGTGNTGGTGGGSRAGDGEEEDDEIVARPTVPTQVPANITVSPATIPPGN